MFQQDSSCSRRKLLGLGAAAGLCCATGPAAAKEVGQLNLADYEKIEPQQFPWGWIRWLMNAKLDPQAEMTLGIVYIQPRQTNPLHMHPNSAELLHVLSGGCEHRLGKKWEKLRPGDTLRIPQGVAHQARTGEAPCLAMILYNTGQRQMTPVSD